MEIPKYWREQPTNIRFEGKEKKLKGLDHSVYKYPGGEIPLVGNLEEISKRFEKKGFSQEATNEILFRLWGGVSSEAAISVTEVANSFFELVGGEVGK